MASIAYPATLPCPAAAPIRSVERRALSPEGKGPRLERNVQRDRLAVQEVVFVPMTPAQADEFDEWWRVGLVFGGAWFTATWPLPQGLVPAVRRFLATPRWSYVPANPGGTAGGYWRVSAVFEVRGVGEIPDDTDPFTVLLLLHGDGYDPRHSPGIDEEEWFKDDSGYNWHVKTVDDVLDPDVDAYDGSAIFPPNGNTTGTWITNGVTEDATNHSEFNLTGLAFTLEARMKCIMTPGFAAGPQMIFGFGSWFVGTEGDGNIRITQGHVGDIFGEVGFSVILAANSGWSKPMGDYATLAVTRNAAGLMTLWWDGDSIGTVTYNPPATTMPRLFGNNNGIQTNYPLRFWAIEEVRYSYGCRYTGPYTPATGPFPNP